MIKYEVNIEIVAKSIAEFTQWLREHVKEILQFDGFSKAEIFAQNDDENASTNKLIVYYEVDSQAQLKKYFELHASEMRAKAIARFGDDLKITRRILTLCEKIQ